MPLEGYVNVYKNVAMLLRVKTTEAGEDLDSLDGCGIACACVRACAFLLVLDVPRNRGIFFSDMVLKNGSHLPFS